ncbi:4-carboxy-4-hydroxy-2-oxoadipate aldolase/oxaloacetate decarboxylase [Enterococcus casseliflavus]|uniref:4-carboxy-4-hydroxy-2-oxoadipate aldolase/oxaloacetate decarboxylase n=1 Tax=Enterococcus casseliflavus TaxID=37734 RepID=UPI001883D7C7|nr:4-carboxy-4-hydroxy-2-oxoadipate aldolase/oxaloacetate decarboxylase [Enterococcus casseliflavus]MBE9906365.1 4-carboxy-4-hydroxy-2-oxoadipate aldolase/oxaloacetate decarboxylase [Enterococcus casseliflavus]
MNKYILKNIYRPSEDTLKDYRKYDVSNVYEAQDKTGLMLPYMRPLIEGQQIVGPAVTVICPPGDNLMVHAAIEVCQPGDILVITTTSGEYVGGMIGELIVTALMKRGIQGVVIDSAARDVAQIRKLGFPVWTRAIYSKGTFKNKGGWVNAPAACAGQVVRGGDLIMADDDGVVVVQKENLAATLASAEKRMRKEATVKEQIAAGILSMDFHNLRGRLSEQGVVYLDQVDDEIK